MHTKTNIGSDYKSSSRRNPVAATSLWERRVPHVQPPRHSSRLWKQAGSTRRGGRLPDDEQQEQPEVRGPRALWSGTISFGLVSIPVELYPATRTQRFALRTLGPEGRPLRREFFCPNHGEPVSSEEIVR